MDPDHIFTCQAPVWIWRPAKPSAASWHFATIEPETSAEIRYAMLGLTKAFGSVPVCAQIGDTRWKTSLFPHKESGGYLLPLKAEVRKRENVKDGDRVHVNICVG